MLNMPRMKPTRGERKRKRMTGIQPVQRMTPNAGLGDGGAGDAGDEGMGGAGGERQEPGDDVPDDGAEESAEDDVDVDLIC